MGGLSSSISFHLTVLSIRTEKTEVRASLTALSNITNLKKLCNHPDLVYEKISEGVDGFENAAKLMPTNYNQKCVRVCFSSNSSGFKIIFLSLTEIYGQIWVGS